jgi:hypothetical protein
VNLREECEDIVRERMEGEEVEREVVMRRNEELVLFVRAKVEECRVEVEEVSLKGERRVGEVN